MLTWSIHDEIPQIIVMYLDCWRPAVCRRQRRPGTPRPGAATASSCPISANAAATASHIGHPSHPSHAARASHAACTSRATRSSRAARASHGHHAHQCHCQHCNLPDAAR